MKKTTFLLFLLTSTALWAQTADQIIQNYINKIGGTKLDQVHAILQKGTMSSNGMDFPMESYQDTSGKIYSKIKMMGTDMTTVAFDGQKGFMFDNASFGYKDIPDSIATHYKSKAKNLFGYFYKYKANGGKVKYLGKQKMDSLQTDAVMLSIAKSPISGINDFTAYFNPTTHLLTALKVLKSGHIIITKPDQYKSFDGILLPTKISTEVDGNPVMTLTIDSIKINPPAPDQSIFIKPKQ